MRTQGASNPSPIEDSDGPLENKNISTKKTDKNVMKDNISAHNKNEISISDAGVSKSDVYKPDDDVAKFRVEPSSVGGERLLRFFLETGQSAWEVGPRKPFPIEEQIRIRCEDMKKNLLDQLNLPQQQLSQEQQHQLPLQSEWSLLDAVRKLRWQRMGKIDSEGIEETATRASVSADHGQQLAEAEAEIADCACYGVNGVNGSLVYALDNALRKTAEEDARDPSADLVQLAGMFQMAMNDLQECTRGQNHQQQQKAVAAVVGKGEAPSSETRLQWDLAAKHREGACIALNKGSLLFDMLLGTIHLKKNVRFLKLHQVYETQSSMEIAKMLCLCAELRKKQLSQLIDVVEGACGDIVHASRGRVSVSAWITLLKILKKNFLIVKKQFQAFEYQMVDADYPFSCEVYVLLQQLPACCWGTYADLKCMLPPPHPYPFTSHYALVKLNAYNTNPTMQQSEQHAQQQADEDDWEVNVEFPETIGHVIQERYFVHCFIQSLDTLEVMSPQQHQCICCSKRRSITCGFNMPEYASKQQDMPEDANAAGEIYLDGRDGKLNDECHRGSTCFPNAETFIQRNEDIEFGCMENESDNGCRSKIINDAETVCGCLRDAQWCLMDLGCMHAFAQQMLLYEEQVNRVVGRRHVITPQSQNISGVCTSNENGIDNEISSFKWVDGLHTYSQDICGPTCSRTCMSAEVNGVSGDRVQLILRNVPICRPVNGKNPSAHTHDFVIHFHYTSSQLQSSPTSQPNEHCHNPSTNHADSVEYASVWREATNDTTKCPCRYCKNDVSFLNNSKHSNSNTTNSSCRNCCMLSIPVMRHFERVCVVSMRQLYMETLQDEAFTAPAMMPNVGSSVAELHSQNMLLDTFPRPDDIMRLDATQTTHLQDKQKTKTLFRGDRFASTYIQWLLQASQCIFMPNACS